MTLAHEFFEGDRVALTDSRGVHTGTVERVWSTGLVTVRWDSGVKEKLHWSELRKGGETDA